jgi:hypothetical protein
VRQVNFLFPSDRSVQKRKLACRTLLFSEWSKKNINVLDLSLVPFDIFVFVTVIFIFFSQLKRRKKRHCRIYWMPKIRFAMRLATWRRGWNWQKRQLWNSKMKLQNFKLTLETCLNSMYEFTWTNVLCCKLQTNSAWNLQSDLQFSRQWKFRLCSVLDCCIHLQGEPTLKITVQKCLVYVP